MLKIRDIMSRDVFTFEPTTSVDQAAWALCAARVGGAPVRDGMGRLLGVISRSDLTDPERNPAGFGRGTVRDLMTPALLTLRASDVAMNAVRLMVREDIHRIIVLDDHGELVGILTSTDIMRALVESGTLADTEPDVET